MNLFKRLNKSKTVFLVLLLCLFVFMLVNNFLTPFIMDDFDYMFNFSNSEPERIVSVSQIVSSMREHRIRLNGRIVAHTIVQLVLMLPKPCFNVLNAAVFTFLIYLIYTLANHGKERNNLLLPAIFVAVWCFEPAFGQSNLWLDGSINYLWATTICILFLIPFLKRVFKGERIKSPVLQALYVIFGFLMGAYSENSSFTAIAVSALIVVSTFEWTAGVKDIYTCNRKAQENKAKIYASIEKGKKEVKVPIVHAETPYFALYGMCYLDQETTYAYPNDAIKWYYGLDSILGYEPKS